MLRENPCKKPVPTNSPWEPHPRAYLTGISQKMGVFFGARMWMEKPSTFLPPLTLYSTPLNPKGVSKLF